MRYLFYTIIVVSLFNFQELSAQEDKPELNQIFSSVNKAIKTREAAIVKEKLLLLDSIVQSDYGTNSYEFSRLLAVRAFNLQFNGDYLGAKLLYDSACTIRLLHFDEDAKELLPLYENIMILGSQMNEDDTVNYYFEKTRGLIGKYHGNSSVKYANLLENRGIFLVRSYNYEKASRFLDTALVIYKKKRHPSEARIYNVKAEMKFKQGNINEANYLAIKSRTILDTLPKLNPMTDLTNLNLIIGINSATGNRKLLKTYIPIFQEKAIRFFGEKHPFYSGTLINIANAYYQLGDFNKAINILTPAVKNTSRNQGHDQITQANINAVLGQYHYSASELETSKHFLEDAIQMYSDLGDSENPKSIQALVRLGKIYHFEGKEVEFKEIVSLTKKYLAKDSLEQSPIIPIKSDLAELLFMAKKYNESEILWDEVIAYRNQNGLNFNSGFLGDLISLGLCYKAKGKYDEALIQFEKSNKLGQSILDHNFSFISEMELINYISFVKKAASGIVSLTELGANGNENIYNSELFYKGYILSESIRRRAILNRVPENKRSVMQDLAQKLYVELASTDLDKKAQLKYQGKIDSLESELLGNERKISLNNNNWKNVAESLSKNSIAIEFLEYRKSDGMGVYTDDTIRLAASVINAEITKPALFISTWSSESPKDQLCLLLGRIFDSIGYENNSEFHVYYAPTQMIQFTSLLDCPSIVNSDKIVMHRVLSTRDLLEESAIGQTNLTAMVIGNIEYELDTTFLEYNNFQVDDEENSELMEEIVMSRGDSEIWTTLPATTEEIRNVSNSLEKRNLKVNSLFGPNASESAFKSLHRSSSNFSPYVIHLATHGYFFPDTSEDYENVFQSSSHPLIRSGLILAGANYAWKHGHPYKEGMEDGILTAYEISQMDLSDTELVVLSACETGLGEIKGSEGVYGLQRAFKIAGVKNIIMSLWKVPDYQTKELMVRFYSNWLEKGMTINRALHAAQYSLRDEGYEPYYWAGWVLLE